MNTQQTDLLRDPTRMRILDAAGKPATAADIAAQLGVPATRVYHHIDKLVSAGLLEVIKHEKHDAAVTRVYQATVETIERSGDEGDIALVFKDALKDVAEAPSDAAKAGGRVVTRVTPAQAGELAQAVERIAADLSEREEPEDGEMYSFTYVVAPLAGPRPDGVTIRPMDEGDVEWVQQTVYAAISWNPKENVPPLEAIVDHPELKRYHDGWGREGDFGVVAVSGGTVVGGAYGRTFTEEDHGHGYLDPDTPELAIGVWDGHRGQGVGTRLLAAFHDEARRRGFSRISLSVNKGNPAVRLYERAGYTLHDVDSGSIRMVYDLTA